MKHSEVTWLTVGYIRFGVRQAGTWWQVVYAVGTEFGVQGGYYADCATATGAAYSYANQG